MLAATVNSYIANKKLGGFAGLTPKACTLVDNAPLDALITAVKNQEVLALPVGSARPKNKPGESIPMYGEKGQVIAYSIPGPAFPDWVAQLPKMIS